MSVIFFDGMDSTTNNNANALGKWDNMNGIGPGSSANPRFASALTITTSGTAYLEKIFPSATYAEGIMGVGIRFNSAGALWAQSGTAAFFNLILLQETTTDQLMVRITADRTIQLVRGGGTVLATSTATLSLNAWHFLEWQFEIADSTTASKNIVKVWTAGAVTTFINLAAASDTKNTANAYFTRFRLGQSNATHSPQMEMDDFYFVNPLGGGTITSFIGEARIHTLRPNGNGNYSQYVGSDGNSVNNSLLVDETTSNDDTDYVEDSTAGNRDSYAYADLPTSAGSIKAVQVINRSKKTDAGARDIKAFVRKGSTDYDGATIALTNSYEHHATIWELDPADAAAWTSADVDGSEFGIKTQT